LGATFQVIPSAFAQASKTARSGVAFTVKVELDEAVRLERNPRAYVLDAAVWQAMAGGSHGGDSDYMVKEAVSCVDKFCLDYLKANPK
jgi:hypothetical protein